MVSQGSITGIEWLFEKAVRDNSVSSSEDACVVSKLAAGKPVQVTTNQHLVVLTISTYLFRIVALFQFTNDAATRAHMAQLAKSQTGEIDEQTLKDTYSELVNMVCGAVNRGLGVPFPHIGLSTPFTLESSCSNYVSALEPEYSQRFEVLLNDSVRFNLTLCLCVGSGVSLDFMVDTYEQEEESGELELF